MTTTMMGTLGQTRLDWHRLGQNPTRQKMVRLAGLISLLGIAIVIAWLPLPLVTTALLGTITILIILLRPVWGLITLLALIPFSPLVSLHLGGVRVGGMEALLALMLIAWLLRMAVRGQVVIPHPPLLVPWLVWLGIILVSWSGALSLGATATETLKWLEMLALYLFMAANMKRRHVPWLVASMLLAGVVQAGLGLHQFIGRVGPEGFLILDGRFLRAFGTFRQPNPYAGYLGLTLPIALSLMLWSFSQTSQNPNPQSQITDHKCQITGHRSQIHTRVSSLALSALLAAATGLILCGLYASQSRGAWIGAAAAVIVVSAVRSKRAAILFATAVTLLTIVGALGAFDLLPESVVQRFADVVPVTGIPNIAIAEVTDANFPAIERMAHWQAALNMWRDHLWLGVGFGNYPAVYPVYAIGRWLDPLGHAHNFCLNVASETGLVGLLAYGLFWLSAVALSWRAVRGSRGFQRAVAIGCLGVLVHLTVHNMVDNLFVQGMYLQVAAVLGLLVFIDSQQAQS